jgi:hypothetical protein
MSGPTTCRIYYSCNKYPTYYIDTPIKRWDEDNDNITIETFLGSGARNLLFQNITPGAIRELSTKLGWVINLDGTYRNSGNTLILEPSSDYGLSGVRSRKVVLVKNASDTFINEDTYNVKLELKEKIDWSDYL